MPISALFARTLTLTKHPPTIARHSRRLGAPMRRNTILSRMLLLFTSAWLTYAAFAQHPADAAHNDVVIKNAIVMTVTHGSVKNGSVYIKDGKIAAVGESVNAPA